MITSVATISSAARMRSPHTFATLDHIGRNDKEVHHG
jgi:hypothetical protein